MERKEFLKTCAGGLCACAAGSLISATQLNAAETPKADDWRVTFVKRRYAKLLEILSQKMDEKTLNETLVGLGTYCSALGDDWIKKFNGDFDAFAKSIRDSKSGDNVTYDREKGIVTMASDERSECFCPFNSANTPKVVCNCSLGWQQHTWETFFQKKVKVELKESVLRGGKKCVFEIRVV